MPKTFEVPTLIHKEPFGVSPGQGLLSTSRFAYQRRKFSFSLAQRAILWGGPLLSLSALCYITKQMYHNTRLCLQGAKWQLGPRGVVCQLNKIKSKQRLLWDNQNLGGQAWIPVFVHVWVLFTHICICSWSEHVFYMSWCKQKCFIKKNFLRKWLLSLWGFLVIRTENEFFAYSSYIGSLVN